ncbi:MAG: hypothetical protein Q9218_004273 [Villophora microphyllina]
MGHKSLKLDNETLGVQKFLIPDSSKGLHESTIFRVIESKSMNPSTLEVSMLQRLWNFIRLLAWFFRRNYKVVWALLAYAFVVFLLAFGSETQWQTLYLPLWTFCVMPAIDKVKCGQLKSYSIFGLILARNELAQVRNRLKIRGKKEGVIDEFKRGKPSMEGCRARPLFQGCSSSS